MIELLCFTRPNQIENAAKNLKKYENKKRTQVSKSLKIQIQRLHEQGHKPAKINSTKIVKFMQAIAAVKSTRSQASYDWSTKFPISYTYVSTDTSRCK